MSPCEVSHMLRIRNPFDFLNYTRKFARSAVLKFEEKEEEKQQQIIILFLSLTFLFYQIKWELQKSFFYYFAFL